MSATKGYQRGGLRLKYQIIKTSGKPIDPEAKYFVLRYDEDPHAVRAIIRYVASIKEENPELAWDLLNQIGRREHNQYPILNYISGLELKDSSEFIISFSELEAWAGSKKHD